MPNAAEKHPEPNLPPATVMAWYQATLSAIGDAVLTTDPEGRVTYMNPVAESLTGWAAEEAHGRPLEDVFRIVDQDSRRVVEQPVREVIGTGQARGPADRTVLIARDGTERPFDHGAAPVRGEDGRLIGVVMTFRDTTDRRSSERLIQAAREFAEGIVSTVREPLLILNADLHVRSANRSFYEAFHVEPHETEGRYIYDLGDGQWDIPALRTLLEEIIPENTSFDDFEVEHDFESIGPRTMLLNARRFPPEGRWELILLGIVDITERKRLEREREGLLRSAEVARDRAEADSCRLADADRQKNEFLAMLAHELRNPIAAVRNAVEVATRTGTREHLEWSRDVTARQVGNFAHLINDLLDVARVTEGKITLRKELIDAAPVVHHAIEAVRPIVDERKHELVLSLTSADLTLEADSTRLEQVLVNLLTNAAKYTPSGGRIQLTVGVEEGEVVFRVRDNGLGILPDVLPRMFDLFAQADRSLDRSEGGLGIGLTLVRSLAELHGGTVTATSDGPGRGSEFVVRLPAAEGRAEAKSGEKDGAAAPPPRSYRVLIVDDNVDSANGLATLLGLSGHEVRVAHDGEEALVTAREHRPEVMLLDIGLPGMDGYELATRLRQEGWSKDSVLIAVTGYAEAKARDRSAEAGFQHHLVKPLNFETLLALVGGPEDASSP
jgi:PAS domain S-box-containing protein